MENFNLIVSTGRDFETQAKTELWFNLLSIGDSSPIFFPSDISGLILASTTQPPRDLIYYLRDVSETKDPHYTQTIHKIYPIDRVVFTNIEDIQRATVELVASHPYCQPNTEFRITIRKRKTDLETKDIISAIAGAINYKVNLQHYDWNIQIEIIGKYTGIAILKEIDIYRPRSERRSIQQLQKT